ncbi:MAG: hypothetical protein ACE5JJ_06940, partial [Nitrospinota bacterium]
MRMQVASGGALDQRVDAAILFVPEAKAPTGQPVAGLARRPSSLRAPVGKRGSEEPAFSGWPVPLAALDRSLGGLLGELWE